MPTRLYSLAKELKLDSKELLDLCRRAGVTAKGSAMASLTDEEVEKIKSYLPAPPIASYHECRFSIVVDNDVDPSALSEFLVELSQLYYDLSGDELVIRDGRILVGEEVLI